MRGINKLWVHENSELCLQMRFEEWNKSHQHQGCNVGCSAIKHFQIKSLWFLPSNFAFQIDKNLLQPYGTLNWKSAILNLLRNLLPFFCIFWRSYFNTLLLDSLADHLQTLGLSSKEVWNEKLFKTFCFVTCCYLGNELLAKKKYFFEGRNLAENSRNLTQVSRHDIKINISCAIIKKRLPSVPYQFLMKHSGFYTSPKFVKIGIHVSQPKAYWKVFWWCMLKPSSFTVFPGSNWQRWYHPDYACIL